MPGNKKHLSIASILWLVFPILIYKGIINISYFMLILYSIFYFIGALFPDLDSPVSKIRKWFNITLLGTSILLLGYAFYIKNWIYVLYAGAGIILVISLYTTKHRGLLHSIITGAIISILTAYYSLWSGIMFICGFLTHIVADAIFEND